MVNRRWREVEARVVLGLAKVVASCGPKDAFDYSYFQHF